MCSGHFTRFGCMMKEQELLEEDIHTQNTHSGVGMAFSPLCVCLALVFVLHDLYLDLDFSWDV